MSSIKIRSKRLGNKTQIRTLITHPMESGINHDKKTLALIPAHFIHTLSLAHNGNTVITSHMGISISKDPFFVFMLKGGNEGDTITLTWEDNLGNSDTENHVLI
jgi:sulfur-oxidizing protein SoxZ